jgi:nucleoside-diphosphate-sugar epimerase
MAKILITGGAGFIGSQLGFHLGAQGHEIILLDNMSYGRLDNLLIGGKLFGNFIGMDIRSKKIFEVMKGVDYVFHFAGIAPLPDCQSDPYHAIDINVAGTANILEAARYNGVKRVVFSSTSAIYENNSKFPCSESDKVSPYLIYSNSKLQSEMLCKSYVETYGLDVVMLRFFNVYGPHQDMARKQPPLIGYVIRELYNDNRPVLHSDGSQRRDYVYTQDVIDLCQLVMTKEGIKSEIFNVCSNTDYSVKEIYQIIANYMGKNIVPKYNKSEDFWNKYPELYTGALLLKKEFLEKEVNKFALGENAKAKAIGWKPRVGMEEGLKKSVDYAVKLLSRGAE